MRLGGAAARPQIIIALSSLCERLGTKLEMHSLARLALAAYLGCQHSAACYTRIYWLQPFFVPDHAS
jgi:hypothetical protein